tara:strand:- start:60337 stop:60903 length:567 start_codon:yes stop_codon:yes gene_type:complete
MDNYSIALETLENRIYDLISELTALPIKWAEDNTNKINAPQYILLKVRNLVEKGIGDDVGWSDTLDKKITAKEWEVTVDIDCRRGKYTQAQLARIIHAFQKHSELYLKYFPDHQFGFLRIMIGITPRNATVDGESWEERSRVTLAFSMVVTDTDLYSDGSIENVEFSSIKTYIGDTVAVDDTLIVNYP